MSTNRNVHPFSDISQETTNLRMRCAPESANEITGVGSVYEYIVAAGSSKHVATIAETAVCADLYWQFPHQPEFSIALPNEKSTMHSPREPKQMKLRNVSTPARQPSLSALPLALSACLQFSFSNQEDVNGGLT